MSGVVRTLSRCLLPAEAAGRAGEQPRRDGKERSRDAEREARRRSREIDAMLARERRAVRRLVKILLLGAGESGKSTFLKQMRIIHGREFDQKALLEFRATIYENILKVRGGGGEGGWRPAPAHPAAPGARAVPGVAVGKGGSVQVFGGPAPLGCGGPGNGGGFRRFPAEGFREKGSTAKGIEKSFVETQREEDIGVACLLEKTL